MLTDRAHVEFSIFDFGPGIPEETLKCIFEPFFTTKSEGVQLSKLMAERYGLRMLPMVELNFTFVCLGFQHRGGHR